MLVYGCAFLWWGIFWTVWCWLWILSAENKPTEINKPPSGTFSRDSLSKMLIGSFWSVLPGRGNKSQEQVRCCWQHLQQQSQGAAFSLHPASGSKKNQMFVLHISINVIFAIDPSAREWKQNHFLRKYFNLVPHKHKWPLSCIKWRPLACCLLVVTHLFLNSWCSSGGKGRVTGNNFMWSIELNYFSLETVVFFSDLYDYFCLFSCGFQARYRLSFHLNY